LSGRYVHGSERISPRGGDVAGVSTLSSGATGGARWQRGRFIWRWALVPWPKRSQAVCQPVFPFSLANQKSLTEDEPPNPDFSLDVSVVLIGDRGFKRAYANGAIIMRSGAPLVLLGGLLRRSDMRRLIHLLKRTVRSRHYPNGNGHPHNIRTSFATRGDLRRHHGRDRHRRMAESIAHTFSLRLYQSRPFMIPAARI
jgi:hypothetical protein